MKIHVLAPFNRVTDQQSPDPFASQTAHYIWMLQDIWHDVVEYGPAGSLSTAETKMPVLDIASWPAQSRPLIRSTLWQEYMGALQALLDTRVKPGDVVAHCLGAAYSDVLRQLPEAIHVEPMVSYADRDFGAFRIYASEAWRCYHHGVADATRKDLLLPGRRSWVIPHVVDQDDWPLVEIPEPATPYVAFIGRLVPSKGLGTLGVLAEAWARFWPDDQLMFRVAGTSTPEFTTWLDSLSAGARQRIRHVGPVLGRDRAEFLGKAAACVMPTLNLEPFGLAGVEAMACGTPMVASDWGGFLETSDPQCGLTCRTPKQWVDAVNRAVKISDRAGIRERTLLRFGRQNVAYRHGDVLDEILSIRAGTWGRVSMP